MKVIYVSLLVLSFMSKVSTAQPLPLKNVVVSAKINMNKKTGFFEYTYKVHNPTQNNQSIADVGVTVSHSPGADATLSWSGLTQCATYFEGMVSKSVIVPTGSRAPKGWSCGYNPQKMLVFGATDDPDPIKPGSSLDGFVITSMGLPSIREVRATVDRDPKDIPPSWQDESPDKPADPNALYWIGKTIGPKAPPANFDAKAFCDYLSLLNEQSAANQWIKAKGLEDELELQISGIKKRLAAKDNKMAKKLIEVLIDKIKKEENKGLSSEAFALLYYNASYLADHL